MRAWGLVDTLTIACLLLVIPWCTQCDKGEGKSIEISDSHKPKTAANHADQVHNNVTSAGKMNISVNLDVSKNATVNASKPPELHTSSREGVLTKQSTLSLPKVESSSGKPFTPRPVAQETPKVLSSADAKKTHDKTIEDSHKEAAKNWMEGGGSLPVPRSKESESSEHKNSNPEVAGEKMPTSTAPHQRVAARKGAILPNDNSSEPHPAHAELVHPHSGPSTVATTSTTRPRKHKPLFTMVQGDKFTSGSESILESPTTGRDYVFPLVLLIFAVPGTVFLIRFLYKRGTEFTERQQYHRMYLIDDEFRTPFFERWKRAIVRFISGDNCQTANLTNIGDTGVHPRTNYNSF